MMKYGIMLLAIGALLFTACAKANDPVGPSSDVLRVEANSTLPGDPVDFEVGDNYICVAEDQWGFSIWNRSDLSLLSRVTGTYQYTKNIASIESLDRVFVYDESGSDTIWIYKIANPANPTLIGSAVGNTAGLADISFKLNPHEFPGEEPAYDCQYVGTRTKENHLMYGYGEIVSDSLDQWRGTLIDVTLPVPLKGFDEDTGYFYVTAEQRGLYIVDKSTLTLLSECDTPGEALGVSVKDNIAYVADRQDGLTVIDITNRTAPVLLDTGYNTSGYAQSIAWEGNWMVVGSGGGGVYLFDITNPAAPVFVDRLSSTYVGYVRKVAIKDGKVYVASRDFGIMELSINQ